MNRLCPVSICECPGGFQTPPDWPILNLSSEAPDSLLFTGIGYVPFDPWRPAPLGDGLYFARNCFGVQFSAQSQDIANLLAAMNAMVCQQDGTVSGMQFSNDAQTAFLRCQGTGLNFSIFYYTVPAGTFVSPLMNAQDGEAWREASNAQALAYAQQQVSALYCCISNPNMEASHDWACYLETIAVGDPNNEFTVTGTNSGANYRFEVVSGSLPGGIRLVQVNHNTAAFEGQYTQTGNFTYTIRATRTDMPNVYAEATYTLEVLGITNGGDLPNCKVDNDYSFQLTGSGGIAPVSYSFSPGMPAPGWMTINSTTGLLGGTPTAIAAKETFAVLMTDAQNHVCSTICSITVIGPKIYPPPPGVVCSVYTGAVTASPAGCTFAGTPPANLTLNPATGDLTGIPTTVQPFTVTVTDPQGNVNSKQCNFITLTPGSKAASVQDIAWTSSVSGANGASMAVTGFGTLRVVVTGTGAFNATQLVATGPLRNCSGSGYNVEVNIDWTSQADDTYGSYVIEWAGVPLWTANLKAAFNPGITSGHVGPKLVTITNGSSSNLNIYCIQNGGSPLVFNITITPLTPP